MREVLVYSRHGCHLCEVWLTAAEPLCRGPADRIVRDVDTRPEWVEAYGFDVPVLLVDGTEVCRHQLDEQALRDALGNS